MLLAALRRQEDPRHQVARELLVDHPGRRQPTDPGEGHDERQHGGKQAAADGERGGAHEEHHVGVEEQPGRGHADDGPGHGADRRDGEGFGGEETAYVAFVPAGRAERPDLVPVLHAMVDLARENEAQPTSRLGEFCRNWVAAREPSTPRRLRPFVDAGLIQGSPRGTGSGRMFYVLTDRTAIEQVLASDSN